MSWLQNTFLEYYKKWLKMVAVQHKWHWFGWKIVSMWTHMYKEKKVAPGFTMAKEQTTILCKVAMLKKIFYLKQVVIYVLRIWIIEGIHQNSASCVRVVYIEVIGTGKNIHRMAQNWNAVWVKSCYTTENINS